MVRVGANPGGGNYYFSSENYGCPTNITFKNTKFGRDYQFGLLSSTCNPYTCGNVWEDTGELVTSANGGWDQTSAVCP